MANAYQYIEVVGTSSNSIEEAIKAALENVAQKHKISWFEVIATRGRLLEEGKPEYQVTVKCGVLPA